MNDINQGDLNEQKQRVSIIEVTKRAARNAIRLYFDPLLHPREALDDLLGRTPEENEPGSGKGTERR